MKKTLGMLMAIVVIGVGFANATQLQSSSKPSDLVLELNLGDLSNRTIGEIEVEVEKFIRQNVPDSQLTCSITVKGSVNVGIAEFEIEVSVSGPCGEIAKSGKKVASDILNQVTTLIKSGIK